MKKKLHKISPLLNCTDEIFPDLWYFCQIVGISSNKSVVIAISIKLFNSHKIKGRESSFSLAEENFSWNIFEHLKMLHIQMSDFVSSLQQFLEIVEGSNISYIYN